MLAKKVQLDLEQSWNMLQEKVDSINEANSQEQAKLRSNK